MSINKSNFANYLKCVLILKHAQSPIMKYLWLDFFYLITVVTNLIKIKGYIYFMHHTIYIHISP